MGRKKRSAPKFEAWCWYCDREFEDEKVLLQHQRAKHYRCPYCPRRLNTAGGLTVHLHQVHKAEPTTIENALPGRESFDIEIYGMVGIPEADLDEWQSRKARRGEGGQAGGQEGRSKRPKINKGVLSVEELKVQLEAHKALMSGKAPPPGAAMALFGYEPVRDGMPGFPTHIPPPNFSRPPPPFSRPPPPFSVPPPGMAGVPAHYAGPPPGFPVVPPPPSFRPAAAPTPLDQAVKQGQTASPSNFGHPSLDEARGNDLSAMSQSYPAVNASVGPPSHDPKANTAEALATANRQGAMEVQDRELDAVSMQAQAQSERDDAETTPVSGDASNPARSSGRTRAADLF